MLKPDNTNRKATALALLSGHGVALFFCLAIPFQLVGRVADRWLAGTFPTGVAMLDAIEGDQRRP